MDEPLKDDLADQRLRRLEAKVQVLVEAVVELMRLLLEEEADRCSQVA